MRHGCLQASFVVLLSLKSAMLCYSLHLAASSWAAARTDEAMFVITLNAQSTHEGNAVLVEATIGQSIILA